MKHYKEVQVPAKTEKRLDHITCDLCGARGDDEYCWRRRYGEPNEDHCEVSVQVKRREGHNMTDCGYGTELEVDLCPECFTGRLVPWLRSQGAKVEERGWDW